MEQLEQPDQMDALGPTDHERGAPLALQRQRHRRFGWLVLAAVACTAGFLACLAFNVGGTSTAKAVDDLGELAAAILAGVVCLRRSRRETGRMARGWRLLGLSAVSWGVGEAVWSYYELVEGRDVPFPSLADAGYLLAVPLALGAMLAFFAPPVGWTSRLRVLVDGLIAATSMLFISWVAVLGATFHATDGSLFTRIVGLAYPAGDVVIFSVVLLVGGRTRGDERLPLAWVSAGLVALAVSDTAFAYLTQKGNYASGNLLDVGWFAGYAIIALAVWKPAADRRRWQGERTALPYVPVLAVLGLIGLFYDQGRPLTGFLLIDACAVFTFVVIRQVLTLRENHSLASDLEAKVQARTADLQRSEERFRSVVQNVSDVISVVRRDGTILYVSPSVQTVLGYENAEVDGRSVFNFLHPDDAPTVAAFLEEAGTDRATAVRRLEVRVRHRDGGWRDTETIGSDPSDGALGGFVLTTRDVTRRKQLEEQLTHQALHDPLTELANRALLADRIEHAMGRIGRTGRDLAVVFVDLDDFKSVNDTVGHTFGDQLLRLVADRLRGCVRPGDTVARLGGDEFAVLMEDATEELAVAAAERLAGALDARFVIHGTEIRVSASAGIATSGAGTRSAADVLRNADVAMYQAKSAGKGRHEVFRPEMHDAIVQRVTLLAELRRAVERSELELYYQPLVTLDTEYVVGFEALVRWRHPTRGMIPPLEFIPLAEETGLIAPIGRWILESALAQLKAWDAVARQGPPPTMSVNMSAVQLEDDEMVSTVAHALAASGIDPSRLTLELTESILLADADAAIARLHELKGLGVRLAIDDFGTGFSSLSYLQRFPVDTLKIDKSFVDDVHTPRGAELTRTMIELGRVLGFDTVAEGIEDRSQVALLKANGCRLGQGFLFARPLSSVEAGGMLQSRLGELATVR